MSKNKNLSRKERSATKKPAAPAAPKVTFVFERENYILLLAGLALIVLGFVLMIGGGSDDPNVFSDDIFSRRRLTVAPLLILAGYVVEVYAIMRKPKEKKEEAATEGE